MNIDRQDNSCCELLLFQAMFTGTKSVYDVLAHIDYSLLNYAIII